MRVGLIGYGLSGSAFHRPFVEALESFELAGVVTSKSIDFPKGVKVVGSLAELIRDVDFELAIITTPNHLHFEQAALCLEAGKHVVVEKPFVSSIDEGTRLVEIARAKNLILSVFQNRRWDGDFLTVKKLLESEVLGKISCFESHFDRFRPNLSDKRWKEVGNAGTGLLFDLGSHLVDQALQLFGNPNEIVIDTAVQRSSGVIDDYFHIVMKYEEMRVILHSSSLVSCPGPRFLIHGTKGSFSKYGLDPQEEMLKTGMSPLDPNFGMDLGKASLRTINEHGNFTDQKVEVIKGNYRTYFEEIFAAIRYGKPNPVPPEQALNCLRLLTGIL